MFSLIKKDLLIQKNILLYGILSTLIIIIAFQQIGDAMFPVAVIALTYVMLQSACYHDDKNNANVLLNVLPIKRSTVVFCRYISVFVFALISISYYAVLTGIMKILSIPLKLYSITIEGVLFALFTLIFINSIYLPLFFKMGYLKSRIINLILFFGVGMLGSINEKYRGFLGSYDKMTIMVILAIFAVIIYGISYILSVKIYKNREF
ncbi:MAG: ABC-2 transporter permease [Thermosediminibacteraceae bacterium]|nr:ABC-2 transporter permease [Thermosediminibacteraceae bacterium]